jgi:hypothetical protein
VSDDAGDARDLRRDSDTARFDLGPSVTPWSVLDRGYPDIQMYDVRYVTFSVSSLVYRAASSGIEQAMIRIPSSECARIHHFANLSGPRASARDDRSARDSNGGEGVIFAT